jgi:plastocyanin
MKISVILPLLLVIFSASCAPRARLSPTALSYPGEPIEIKMENFSFKPNHFSVLKDQFPIILHLKNTDGILHNFSLMAPDREILLSQDLEPGGSVTVNLESLKVANYAFYCFFHQYRGMKGMLMVN